ncbi:MAG TPA: hypothetical protein VNE63_10910 [Candidatus Acidoferrales bacterium]|nr:hypothetical protein [Candidatus Acidoferrales bacterium]
MNFAPSFAFLERSYRFEERRLEKIVELDDGRSNAENQESFYHPFLPEIEQTPQQEKDCERKN